MATNKILPRKNIPDQESKGKIPLNNIKQIPTRMFTCFGRDFNLLNIFSPFQVVHIAIF